MTRSALVLSFLSFAIAQRVDAQQATTCGWHFVEPTDTPPTLRTLLRRPSTPALKKAGDGILAWYRECDSPAVREAAQVLRALAANRNDTVAKALLGIALLRGPEVQLDHAEGAVIRPHTPRSNAEKEGIRVLSELIERTTWPEPALELAAVQSVSRNEDNRDKAAALLARRAPTISNAAVWAGVAELQLARREYAAAKDAAEHAASGASARGIRVLGILQLLSEKSSERGAQTYLSGLRDDGDAIHQYYDDIRLLLAPDELRDWNEQFTMRDAATTGSVSRAEWIRSRWDWRAQLAGIRISERIAEHHRRYEVTQKLYPRPSYRGAPLLEQIWMDEAQRLVPIDDRGLIYLRFGEPDEVLRMRPAKGRMVWRISWVYKRAVRGPAVYEFDVSPDRTGYFLAQPIAPLQCMGKGGALEAPMWEVSDHSVHPAAGNVDDWSTSIFGWDHSLGLYYNTCSDIRYLPMLAAARQRAAEALRTENAVPDMPDPLPASLNLYAFRAPNGGSELISYVSIDAGSLHADSTRRSTVQSYAVDILFSAGNPVSKSVQRTDTAVTFELRQQPAAGALIGTAVSLAVVQGDETRVSLSIKNRNDARQGAVLVTTKVVPAYTTDRFALSDLVIAEARDGTWRRGSHRLAPWRGHAVPLGSPFRLYLEMYGARAGDPVHVMLTISPGRDESVLARLKDLVAKRQAYSVEFDEVATIEDADASAGVARIEREIGTGLEDGSYVFEVTVRNNRSGETATSRTNLIIAKNK